MRYFRMDCDNCGQQIEDNEIYYIISKRTKGSKVTAEKKEVCIKCLEIKGVKI